MRLIGKPEQGRRGSLVSRRVFVGAASACAAALLVPALGRAADKKRIFLVTWRGFEEGCKGFVAYLDTRGIPYELIHRDVARDKKKLPGVVAEIRKDKPDLVVTWGTTVSVNILGTFDGEDPAKHVTDIPSVFMFPANPKRSKLVPNYRSSERNVTGVRYVLSEGQQIDAALRVVPFKKAGTLYHDDEINSVNALHAYRTAADKRGVGMVAEKIAHTTGGPETIAAIEAAVQRLKDAGAEIIFFPPSSLLNQNVDEFTAAALAAKVPVFSSGQHAVRKSKALLGVGVPYFDTGKRAAALAERILFEGVHPSKLPIEPPRDFGFVINLPVAHALGLEIPPEVLSVADVIR